MKRELFIVGTRPEIIKVAPLARALGHSRCIVLHTGQHRELADEAFDAFNIMPAIRLDLMKENQTLAGFVMDCTRDLTLSLRAIRDDISRVWVQGDTSTALVGAQVAKLLSLPVVHLEAGLRSFDMQDPWPEELFRVQIDAIADILLAPTDTAAHNLYKSVGMYGKHIEVTGNTIVDALELLKPQLRVTSPQNVPFVLATIHRRESFGPRMIEIFRALRELSKEIKVVLPAHPNPNVRLALEEVGLSFVEPMPYLAFLNHLKFCEYVITDSGGVQEEAPSFGKKTIVLRDVTERPEAFNAGLSTLVQSFDMESIIRTIKEFASKDVVFSDNPFGDGHASDRIITALNQNAYDN